MLRATRHGSKDKLAIGIDMSSVTTPHRTGVATYIVELVSHLANVDPASTYYLCYRLSRLKRRKYFLTPDRPNVKTALFQEPFTAILQNKLGLFHGPDARLPQFKRVPMIATILDLFSLVSTEFASEKFREMKRRRYQDIAERASHIIAVSESTKRDIVEHLCVSPERVTSIHPSISSAYKPQKLDDCLSVRTRYGIKTDYIVCVGNVSRRKNIARLLEAFARLPDSLLKTVTLVLAGQETYGSDEIISRIRTLSLEDKVLPTGYVPQEHLPLIVSGARAAVFVSLYEGFGFPVLEAMACGVPVVTSNVSSLPEVAGDAAVLVDPYDTNAIRDAIEQTLTDTPLRENLKVKGFARVSQFSWQKTASSTVALYKRVASQ